MVYCHYKKTDDPEIPNQIYKIMKIGRTMDPWMQTYLKTIGPCVSAAKKLYLELLRQQGQSPDNELSELELPEMMTAGAFCFRVKYPGTKYELSVSIPPDAMGNRVEYGESPPSTYETMLFGGTEEEHAFLGYPDQILRFWSIPDLVAEIVRVKTVVMK